MSPNVRIIRQIPPPIAIKMIFRVVNIDASFDEDSATIVVVVVVGLDVDVVDVKMFPSTRKEDYVERTQNINMAQKEMYRNKPTY